MRLRTLIFAFKSTNLFAFKNCYHHDRAISLITPLSTRRGVGGEAGVRLFSFLFAKLITIPSKTNIFSGYTSSKFCKDARNQLSHRKIAKKNDYVRKEEAPTSPLPPQQQDRKTKKVDSDNAAEKIAITQITNHKIIIRNFNTRK